MKFKLSKIILLLFILTFLSSCFSKENNNFKRKTIMVFSPHQDDEANMANAIMYSRAKQGADVYVVIAFGSTVNGRNDSYGLGRLRESAENMKFLGLCPSNLIYLGYQTLAHAAIGKEKIILTNNFGEILKADNSAFSTCSHVEEGFPSFHNVKYGKECTVSEENLLSDLTDILQQYKPDEIYSINYDRHPDHIWIGSLVEQALGIVKSKAGYEDYCPRFYQSMSYQSSWYAKRDMMSTFSPNDPKRNILESTLQFKPLNTTFEWNKRIRFPVDDLMSIPDVNSNLSTLAFKYGFGKRVAERLLAVVNGDQIFWERDTRSKSFQADISVSSNEAEKRYLNDFSITRVPLKMICQYLQTPCNDITFMLNLYDCHKWSPEGNDNNKAVTLNFNKPIDINTIRLYDDPLPENQIVSGLFEFSDGSSIDVNALNNLGSATVISFPTKKGISFVRFQIKEYKGIPGLTEFEVYAPENPRSPDFIQIYLSAANNVKCQPQSFLYDYPVDVSQQSQTMQLAVYRYPDETPTPIYNWQITDQHDGIYFDTNGILHVEQSTPTGKYTVKVIESDALNDTMTINVINNSVDGLIDKTDTVSSQSFKNATN